MSISTASAGAMNLSEFNRLVALKKQECPEWRHGQALFNVAWEQFKDAINNGGIIGGDRDPFYSDERIPAFLCFLIDSGCFSSEESQ